MVGDVIIHVHTIAKMTVSIRVLILVKQINVKVLAQGYALPVEIVVEKVVCFHVLETVLQQQIVIHINKK